MNKISTLIGICVGFAAVLTTMIVEGGNPISFINPGAFVLIVAGSLASAMSSFSFATAMQAPKFLTMALFPKTHRLDELINTMVSFSEKARREGLLVLEDDVPEIEDELLHKGIEMVVDGTDPELVNQVLSELAASIEHHEGTAAEFFEALGGFMPTMGIVGTVMGLVHVLEGLGAGDMGSLGEGIAVAFIATFYGIGFANIIALPIANRLKYLNKELKVKHMIIINGVSAIQSGSNPTMVRETLISSIGDGALRKQLREKSAD